MNLSEVMTRIKFKLGIANIASPIRNIDGTIATIIKDITIPDFSIYCPDRMTLRLDLNQLEMIENTNSYKTYLLPEWQAKKLIYVFQVYYDDNSVTGFGHYGGIIPTMNGSMISQVLMANAITPIYNQMMPKITFEYIHPRRLRIYNQYSESQVVMDLGFQHDASLASIPESARTSFLELALLDVKENLYPIFRNYANLQTAYGNIDLKIDSWESAESERKDLLNRWDDVYHLDQAGPGIYYN